jgi:hypothetical protein
MTNGSCHEVASPRNHEWLLPSQQTMHLMAKAAVTVYEAAVENQDRDN